MTFAIAIATREAVMVAADRRLSGTARVAGHAATKVCRIGTANSHGIMTYAGAGARVSAQPFEISTWLERLLRGHIGDHNATMQEIEKAANEQCLAKLGPNHAFAFAGFMDGKPLIDILMSEKLTPEIEKEKEARGTDFWRFRTMVPPGKNGFCTIGTGNASFKRDRLAHRAAKYLKRSSRVPAYRDRAAALMSMIVRNISQQHADVSPECVCCWTDTQKTGQIWIFDAHGQRMENGEPVPIVDRGWDVSEMSKHIGPLTEKWVAQALEARLAGRPIPEIDREAMQAALAKIDLTPKRKF